MYNFLRQWQPKSAHRQWQTELCWKKYNNITSNNCADAAGASAGRCSSGKHKGGTFVGRCWHSFSTPIRQQFFFFAWQMRYFPANAFRTSSLSSLIFFLTCAACSSSSFSFRLFACTLFNVRASSSALSFTAGEPGLEYLGIGVGYR